MKSSNIAFIDGQNLHLGLKEAGWCVDFKKFRIYLSDKYKIKRAYYFLGFQITKHHKLYSNLRNAGFDLVFKSESPSIGSKKKGNVDTDIVFEMMKSFIEEDISSKILLVSGDGDYKRTVDYLIQNGRFLKILLPNKRYASNLYIKIHSKFRSVIGRKELMEKLSRR